jgi:formamidopyrimidine-DNA glycosylase
MAELPELETLRRELEKEAVGKRFKVPEVTGTKIIRHNGSKKAFQARLEGAKVKSVDRRGTFLVANLDNGELLLIELGPVGRLEKVAPKTTPPKGTALVLTFTQGGQIRLVDPTGVAQAFVVASDALGAEVPEVAAGGLDPVADAVSWTSFARVLLSRSAKLKNLLMDPHVVAGIGPIYSDEILWEAGLRYDRTSDSLSSQEIRRLFRALVETLHEAVKHRGTTIDESPFVDLYGKPGDYQDELKVFAREGEPCRRCRAPIVKSRVGNKPLYHCEACQV